MPATASAARGPQAGTPRRRKRLRTWFRDLRVSRKLKVVILVHLLHACILLVVTAYGMKALTASRAYVEGEGLWGKAEKESVVQLTAYVESGDVAHYKAFLREINVTLGDHRAREELDKANPDMQVVRQGFVEGKLSPADVPNLAWLYRTFGWEPHISSAVHVWRVADENITVLVAEGAQLHDAVSAPVRDQAKIDAIILRVYDVDSRLTILEDQFSRTLGDGARWLAGVATWSAVGLTILFVGGALTISSLAARQVTKSLSRLEHAAERVTQGDLESRAGVEGKDEVASVGRAFDQMAVRLGVMMREAEARTNDVRESLERFQVLAEGSPMGIFHTDAAGKVDYANPRWMEIAGCDYRDHAAIRAAVHPEDLEPLSTSWRNSLAQGAELRAEFRYVHHDGQAIPCATRATPLHDTQGRVVGYVGTIEDMTERRVAEQAGMRDEEQAREIERLEEINAFRTRFINTAAHELRTPLTPMRAEMYLLRKLRSEHYSEKERHSLEMMHRNLERLGVLVEDLLQVARYQGGRLSLETKSADLHTVVREAVESFAQAAAERQLNLTLDLSGSGLGEFDAKRVSQVVYNLLGNAVKFTPAGGHIRVDCADVPGGLRISVSDDGIGVDHDGLKRLFQPFSQVHDTQEVTQPGSGLGLYICKAIVELHGGTIQAASDGLGKGSRFTVFLPRHQHPAANPGTRLFSA